MENPSINSPHNESSTAQSVPLTNDPVSSTITNRFQNSFKLTRLILVLIIMFFVLILGIALGYTLNSLNTSTSNVQVPEVTDDNPQSNDVTNVFNTSFDLTKTKWQKVNNTNPEPSNNLSTGGRLAVGLPGSGDAQSITNGVVIKDGDLYRMWYSALERSGFDKTRRIYYAFSFDGKNWIKYDNSIPENTNTTSTNGRLGLGLPGSGDDTELANPEVVKVNGKYYMWYVAKGSGTHDTREYKYTIYLATSPDGLTWTKVNNAIPERSDSISTDGRIALGTEGKADQDGISHIEVVYKDNIFHMWYNQNGRMYYAKSNDGLTWTKLNNNLAPDGDGTFSDGQMGWGTVGKGDEKGVSFQAVYFTNGKFYAVYSGISASDDGSTPRTAFCAVSPDGLTWTKVNNNLLTSLTNNITTDCRLPRGLAGSGDSGTQNALNVIDMVLNGDTAYLYYLGVDAAGTRQAYMAESK